MLSKVPIIVFPQRGLRVGDGKGGAGKGMQGYLEIRPTNSHLVTSPRNLTEHFDTGTGP